MVHDLPLRVIQHRQNLPAVLPFFDFYDILFNLVFGFVKKQFDLDPKAGYFNRNKY